VEPTTKLAGEAGVTAMEDNVVVVVVVAVVVFDPHAAMPRVKDAINPITRK